MRILYVAPQPSLDHADRQPVRAWVREALARGHSARVLAFAPEEGLRERPARLDPSALMVECVDPARHGFALPVTSAQPYPSCTFAQLSSKQLESYLELLGDAMDAARIRFRPDVVHVDGLWFAAAMARSLFHQTPVVATCHSEDLAAARAWPELTRRVVPPARGLERVFCATADQARQAGVIYGIRSDRLHLLGYGVDSALFFPAELATSGEFSRLVLRHDLKLPTKTALRVVHAGPLKTPGVEALAEVMAGLSEYEAELLLVATVDEWDEEVAGRLAGKRHVHVVNAPGRDFVGEMLRGCHAAVVLGESQRVAVSALESLACGCRVLMPDFPALRDWPPKGAVDAGAIERVAALGELLAPQKHCTGNRPTYGRLLDELGQGLRALLERGRDGRLNHTAVRITSRLSWGAHFRGMERLYATLSGVL